MLRNISLFLPTRRTFKKRKRKIPFATLTSAASEKTLISSRSAEDIEKSITCKGCFRVSRMSGINRMASGGLPSHCFFKICVLFSGSVVSSAVHHVPHIFQKAAVSNLYCALKSTIRSIKNTVAITVSKVLAEHN